MADQTKKEEYSLSFMVLTFLASIVVSSIAKLYMRGNISVGVGGCTIALIFAARIRWDLRARWWFWTALCVGGLLQVPLLFLPWSNRYITGIGALAFVIPGFLISYGSIICAEKLSRVTQH